MLIEWNPNSHSSYIIRRYFKLKHECKIYYKTHNRIYHQLRYNMRSVRAAKTLLVLWRLNLDEIFFFQLMPAACWKHRIQNHISTIDLILKKLYNLAKKSDRHRPISNNLFQMFSEEFLKDDQIWDRSRFKYQAHLMLTYIKYYIPVCQILYKVGMTSRTADRDELAESLQRLVMSRRISSETEPLEYHPPSR